MVIGMKGVHAMDMVKLYSHEVTTVSWHHRALLGMPGICGMLVLLLFARAPNASDQYPNTPPGVTAKFGGKI